MKTRTSRLGVGGAVVLGLTLLAAPTPGTAQWGGEAVPFELWGNVILDYPQGERWLVEADLEPKTLVSGGEKWWNLDVTPLVEYYPSGWVDLVGETVFGHTRQTDEVDTNEVSPRIGFRLNLLDNLRERTKPHRKRRLRLATLVRFENRNLWYSDGSPSQHGWRFRVRLEAKVGINRADFSKDRSLYGIFDVEGYVPLGEGVSERYASKVRARVGLGYRLRYQDRFEILYIRDWHRDSRDSSAQPTANVVDARFKLYF